jgi:hypothetical protein
MKVRLGSKLTFKSFTLTLLLLQPQSIDKQTTDAFVVSLYFKTVNEIFQMKVRLG